VTGDWCLELNRRRSELPSALINFPTASHSALIRSNSSAEILARSRLKSMKYRVSSSSPRAICNVRNSSLVVPRPKPSAIFAATEDADLLT